MGLPTPKQRELILQSVLESLRIKGTNTDCPVCVEVHTDATPQTCVNCKHGHGGFRDYALCALSLIEGAKHSYELFDCDQFDPRFVKLQSPEGFVAEFDLANFQFRTAWVDYVGRQLICPMCGRKDWELYEGLDAGHETCLSCDFNSVVIDWRTFLGPTVDGHDLRNWNGRFLRGL